MQFKTKMQKYVELIITEYNIWRKQISLTFVTICSFDNHINQVQSY